MPFNLGIGEVLVVLVVALLVFGKRLPQVGRSLGRGLVEFKEGLKGAAASLKDTEDSEPDPVKTPLDGAEGLTELTAEGEEEEEKETLSEGTFEAPGSSP